jgi:hypothetical protein
MNKVDKVYQETMTYVSDWLKAPNVSSQLAKDEPVKLNVECLTDIGLIKELLLEQTKGLNFDRLNAYSMLFLERQERLVMAQLSTEEDVTEEKIQQILHHIKNLTHEQ